MVLLQPMVAVGAMAEVATEVATAILQDNPPGGRLNLLANHILLPFVNPEIVLSRYFD